MSWLANLRKALVPVKTATAVSPSRVEYTIRNRFNPIRELKPETLATTLDAYHAGNIKGAARLWDSMKRRDVYLRNVTSKREKSVARLPWTIETKDDSQAAKDQAQALKDFYSQISVTNVLQQDEQGGIELLIRQMMDAIGKGFAVHEIVWQPNPNGLRAQFRFCPLWWFENRTGKLRFLPEDAAIEGNEMPEGEWLVTAADGLMECSSVAYVFKHLPLKDWLSFSEKFGLPGVLGKTNAPKDSPEWVAMEEAVRSLMSDWAAVASANDVIELIETKGGAGNLPFPPLVDYCDRAIAALWRGADLSTISQGGKDSVGASLQSDETELLQEDDARLISGTLQQRVDKYALQAIYGPDVEVLAFIRLQGRTTKDEADFKRQVFIQFLADGTVNDVMANLTDLKELTAEVGLPVNKEYTDPYLPVKDAQGNLVTGETLRDGEGDVIGAIPQQAQQAQEGTAAGAAAGTGGAPVLPKEPTQGGALANTAPQDSRLMQAASQEFAGATREAFKPVAVRLQRIFGMENEAAMRMELNQLLADWPQLKGAVLGKEPVNAQVLEEAMAAALLNGLSQKATKGTKK